MSVCWFAWVIISIRSKGELLLLNFIPSGSNVSLNSLSPKHDDQMLYVIDSLTVCISLCTSQTERDSDGGQLQH